MIDLSHNSTVTNNGLVLKNNHFPWEKPNFRQTEIEAFEACQSTSERHYEHLLFVLQGNHYFSRYWPHKLLSCIGGLGWLEHLSLSTQLCVPLTTSVNSTVIAVADNITLFLAQLEWNGSSRPPTSFPNLFFILLDSSFFICIICGDTPCKQQPLKQVQKNSTH